MSDLNFIAALISELRLFNLPLWSATSSEFGLTALARSSWVGLAFIVRF